MATALAGIRNDSWVRSSFLIARAGRSSNDRRARLESGARIKFADTTLGGARCINPPPQFTVYADMTVAGLNTMFSYSIDNPVMKPLIAANDMADDIRSGATASRGMGRAYSEMYDDTGEYITMRFGVPKFNSLLSFFFTFYDPEASVIARTGKGPGLFYRMGQALGWVVGFAYAPVMFAGKAISFLLGSSVSRFYYLDPTMHNYWSAANNIANSIAVNMGIIPRVGGRDETKEEAQARMEEIKHYNEQLPDIFRKDGGIDLFGVANRYNRLALKFQESVNELAIQATSKGAFVDAFRNWTNAAYLSALTDTNVGNVRDYVSRYLNAQGSQFENISTEALERQVNSFKVENETNVQVDSTGKKIADPSTMAKWSFTDAMEEHEKASMNDGSEFVTFRVDSTGPTTTSFSNTVGESEISQNANGMTARARSVMFNAAQFQTGIGVIDEVAGAVKGMMAGGLDMIGVSNLTALMGNAFVDIPQTWQSAAASLPAPSYTIELRSWSGDPISRFKNIWIPVSMLLAGVLPLATGKQSYTSPFICEAYSRSRHTIKLGMIRDLTITTGVGTMGRNQDGDPLGVTVTFSIVDLSSIVTMPISTEAGFWSGVKQTVGKMADGATGAVVGENRFFQGAATLTDPTTWDDSNKYSELMAVFGGLTLQEQIYTTQKLKIAMTKMISSYESWTTTSAFQNKVGGWMPVRMLNLFTKGTVSNN
jgi:hypothetical protein